MFFRTFFSTLAAACVLAACGGDAAPPLSQQTKLLAGVSASTDLRSFPGVRADYAITATTDGYIVVDLVRGGASTAVGPDARLRFADTSVSFAIEGTAGAAYRLYQAAFNRTPDRAGLGFWLDALERGVALDDVAAGFVASAEYKSVYGANPSNRDIVARFYQNVLRRPGDSAGIAFWEDALNRGAASVSAVLMGFSDSKENKQGVLPAVQNGIAFLEAGVPYVPVANAGLDRKIKPYAANTLDGGASSVTMGKPIAYAWTMTERPAGSMARLIDANSAHPSFVADIAGAYEVQLVVSDGTQSSRPVKVSLDASVWEMPAELVPASGNFVYLQSQPGDYIGGGASYLHKSGDSVITLRPTGPAAVTVSVEGDKRWNGDFAGMTQLTRIERGYYGDLTRYPFHDPAIGGLSWSGNGRGCGNLTGWFLVDSVTYEGNTLTAIDLRFEQHCEGAGPALRGRIRWSADDSTAAPGPVNPPPAGLWQPAPGATPASGNYVYLTSSPGDFVGAGRTYTYTGANAQIEVTPAFGAQVNVRVVGDTTWHGSFAGMHTLAQLQPGYYGDLQRLGTHNPVKGALDWGGDGRGCNMLTGWFLVDSVTYEGNTLTAIDLRFEQHCEGAGPALRGRIRWSANDSSAVPGPVNPPPAGLWQPAPGATPASGNYVYFTSVAGDYVGAGRTYTYTGTHERIEVWAAGAQVEVRVHGAATWGGKFAGMNTLARLQPGYYGDLQRWPFHNPVKGGLDWGGEGRGCNKLSGWFVLDKVVYVHDALTEIELRFQQYCDGSAAPLSGKIRWSAAQAQL